MAETFERGNTTFFGYVIDQGITEKVGSAQAIWQVGKGDGVYLDILNRDGTVKDWAFMQNWIKGN